MWDDDVAECRHEKTVLVVDGARECIGPGRVVRLVAWERVERHGARVARAVCEICGAVLANVRKPVVAIGQGGGRE